MLPSLFSLVNIMIKKYLSTLMNALDEIEKESEKEIDGDNKYYFSTKFTIFQNDIMPAKTIEEKIYNTRNIDNLIESMKDRTEDIELAVKAALAYMECGGGEKE